MRTVIYAFMHSFCWYTLSLTLRLSCSCRDRQTQRHTIKVQPSIDLKAVTAFFLSVVTVVEPLNNLHTHPNLAPSQVKSMCQSQQDPLIRKSNDFLIFTVWFLFLNVALWEVEGVLLTLFVCRNQYTTALFPPFHSYSIPIRFPSLPLKKRPPCFQWWTSALVSAS